MKAFGDVRKYSLYAVVVHQGRQLTSGHYYVIIRSGKKWYEINDHKVSTAYQSSSINPVFQLIISLATQMSYESFPSSSVWTFVSIV